MEARYVKGAMMTLLGGGAPAFLDSDNLNDLNQLLDHVRKSEALILFQTKDVLQRPFCILEVNEAIVAQVRPASAPPLPRPPS